MANPHSKRDVDQIMLDQAMQKKAKGAKNIPISKANAEKHKEFCEMLLSDCDAEDLCGLVGQDATHYYICIDIRNHVEEHFGLSQPPPTIGHEP